MTINTRTSQTLSLLDGCLLAQTQLLVRAQRQAGVRAQR